MRIFKGLENVHAIIDQHEAEWRRENGEEPLQPRPRIRARAQNIERQVVERYTEPLSPSAAENERAKFDPERFSKSADSADSTDSAEPQVKAINVIEQGDGEHHSWLYKEVMKAINDAAAGNKNVKIVAVFVPVIQNSKEFDNFPADETVTVSSAVNEDDVHAVKSVNPEVNNADIVEDLIPPVHVEADSELKKAFQTIEKNLDSSSDSDSDSEPGIMIEAPDESDESGDLQEESGELPEEPSEPKESESESESEIEGSAEPLKYDEIHEDLESESKSESESNSDSESGANADEDEIKSDLPDIPDLDSNPDELNIGLEEPSEANDLNKLDKSDAPEEPDAGFPFPDDPEDDAIIEDGDIMDSESHEEGSDLESELLIQGSEEDSNNDKDKASDSESESESESKSKPKSELSSESDSESESEKPEDFGEIDII